MMRLSKTLISWYKALPRSVSRILLAVGSVVALALVAWVGIITHDRESYEAIGSIRVAHENTPTKYYTLKVGDLNEAAKNRGMGFTDTIFVSNSAAHWYSIFNHKQYTVTSATWPDGQKLTLSDVVLDQVDHKSYVTGPGCTIPNRTAKAYCVDGDGKGYYVAIEKVGSDIVTQLNGPQ